MRGAFFSEIRLRRVKLLRSEIGLCPVKLPSAALRRILFHFAVKPQNFTTVKPLFHILRSKIFYFFTLNYSLFTKKLSRLFRIRDLSKN